LKLLQSSILVVLLLLIFSDLSATHNRAGEITYSQIGPLTIRATVTTYTKTTSQGADRDTIVLSWGDGALDAIPRANGNGEPIPGEDIKVNFYIMEHTYPSIASYTLSFQDPNRVSNIQNINFPNSVDIPFYIETRFTLTTSQFQGPNNSVVLLQPPIDFGCVGKRFIHNPNAFDPDGDSISYELTTPLQEEGVEVPRYILPDNLPGSFGTLTINSITGDLIWDSPHAPGEYNVAILIKEFRDGVLLNTVIRDMQILVLNCVDTPPVVEAPMEICVIAGETLRIPVRVTDIDTGQQVRISARGGPFELDLSPAFMDNQNIFQDSPLEEIFVWETQCEHISDSYYQVIFRGQDNSRIETGNASLKSLRIRVLGPPPENVTAELENNDDITLTWDMPYSCEDASNNFFLGFEVYRREGPDPFPLGECENGLEGRGYEVVEILTTESANGRYTFTDSAVNDGAIFCYRITANFALRTATNQPFNLVESIASQEVCLQVNQDEPLITKVSVMETSRTDGEILVSWNRPKAEAIDTLLNSGPYNYRLERSSDAINFTEVANIPTPSFFPAEEISFTDRNLNTVDNQYFYRINFSSNNQLLSNSSIASSVFSSIISTDMLNIVSCQEEVPWVNTTYFLERQNMNGGQLIFQTIDESSICDFEDRGLMNDTTFCYRVRTLGRYGIGGNTDSLVNLSQIVCGIPIDTVGPCPPIAMAQNPCSDITDTEELIEPEDFFNLIFWESIRNTCDGSNDVESYNIYFAEDSILLNYELIGNINEGELLEFQHLPEIGVNGCYAISSIDASGNEGPIGTPACIDNCPIYILPNAFTPNGDGANDIFHPRQNLFVAEIDFKLFNRWGNLLFETTEPEINWDGNTSSGKNVEAGTYYYTCSVLERGTDGLVEAFQLQGYIQLLR